jgi:hypothetical protein
MKVWTAKMLLNKLKKLLEADLRKPIYYCDMPIVRLNKDPNQISLR